MGVCVWGGGRGPVVDQAWTGREQAWGGRDETRSSVHGASGDGEPAKLAFRGLSVASHMLVGCPGGEPRSQASLGACCVPVNMDHKDLASTGTIRPNLVLNTVVAVCPR